jgi:hypothetical protein
MVENDFDRETQTTFNRVTACTYWLLMQHSCFNYVHVKGLIIQLPKQQETSVRVFIMAVHISFLYTKITRKYLGSPSS